MKTVKCKSGLIGWRERLQKVYTSYEEFKEYNRNYDIAKRLGYPGPYAAWHSNPIIEGSTNPSDLRTVGTRTLSKIICPVDGKYGAPMGRSNIGTKPTSGKIFDTYVPMSDGAYDRGGAYWGTGKPLRVSYTKDLKYIHFYRLGDE